MQIVETAGGSRANVRMSLMYRNNSRLAKGMLKISPESALLILTPCTCICDGSVR